MKRQRRNNLAEFNAAVAMEAFRRLKPESEIRHGQQREKGKANPEFSSVKVAAYEGSGPINS